MKQYFLRLVALVLVLCAILPLAACGGGGGISSSESESRSESESESASESQGSESEGDKWEAVDFGGEELRINTNVYQSIEWTFGPADIYSRGPDSLEGADEVGKMVYDRNLNLESELGLSVIWDETNVFVMESQAVIETFVKMSPENSPDIFITYLTDVVHSMLTNSLWNVYDTSDGKGGVLESYFDFTHPTWFEEYMAGTSITSEKRYALVSDYNIDVIRLAFVLYVNRGLFDEVMQGNCINVHDLYEYVKEGIWDYDLLMQFMEIAHQDTVNYGTTDKEDERKGLIASAHLQRVFTWTSGLSIIGWDGEIYDSNPYVVENHPDYFTYAGKFSEVYNTPGMYYSGNGLADAQAATMLFLDGSYLFALSPMGEMESETVRDSQVNKGVLPMPKFDLTLQSDYYTLVHDQADLCCILKNARHFTAASAYLQRASEDSVDIMKQYYEKTLKLKYNEDKDTQAMLDLIHDRIVTPFDLTIARLISSGGAGLPDAPYQGTEIFTMVYNDALENKTAFSSSWAAAYDGWCKNLDRLVEIFEELD